MLEVMGSISLVLLCQLLTLVESLVKYLFLLKMFYLFRKSAFINFQR